MACCQKAMQRVQRWQVRAQTLEFGNRKFGRNVSHKGVLCEGAAAQAAEGHVKTTASCAIGRAHFCRYVFRTGMQMYANLDIAL
jgi:hypothetical protein